MSRYVKVPYAGVRPNISTVSRFRPYPGDGEPLVAASLSAKLRDRDGYRLDRATTKSEDIGGRVWVMS
jgi:hypothetical protein